MVVTANILEHTPTVEKLHIYSLYAASIVIGIAGGATNTIAKVMIHTNTIVNLAGYGG